MPAVPRPWPRRRANGGIRRSRDHVRAIEAGREIAHQRRMSDEAKRSDRWCELLANSCLHAVDSYFNVLRQRVSYLHRPGFSRSSQNWYNAFQAYRPAMIQKITDIARVYFNWVEPRPFRVSRRFSPLTPIFDSGHEVLAFAADEQVRRKW